MSARDTAEIARIQARQDAWDNGGAELWHAAHDYPRCVHGLSRFAICEDCRGWEVPASATPAPSNPVRRCVECGGSGASRRDYVDICAACWGSGDGA